MNGDFGLTGCTGFSIPGFTDFVALLTASPDPNLLAPGAQTIIPGNFGFCGFAFGGDALVITLQEAENCNALVRQKGVEAGLTCPPAP